MILTLNQIRAWLELPGAGPSGEVRGFSIDSRTLEPADLFFAIRGPVHDGHAFVADAFARGAAAAIVQAAYAGPAGGALLRVGCPAAALRALAARARREWAKTVIAVTGSGGKTTTKETIAALLGEVMAVSKSAGNLNNEYGLPLSLLRTSDAAAASVVEIGVNHPGEMRPLADLAAPDIGVVTNVGSAHLGNFPSVDAIAVEKGQLVQALRSGGTAVLNADDPRVAAYAASLAGPVVTFGIERAADVRARHCEDLGAAGCRFEVDGVPLESPLPGRHNIANVLAALAVARVLGIGAERLRGGVARLRPASMRGAVRQVGGVTLIDDCYNANPDAMEAMLEVLRRTSAQRRIAVLGEMRELGTRSRELHRRVGEATARAGLDYLVAVGGDAAEIAAAANVPAEFCACPQDAAALLTGRLRPGDAVLLKASRGVALERVRDALLAELDRQASVPEAGG